MEAVLPILASIAIGLAVGIVSGLLGVGGGTVLVPVFKLLYGLPGIVATATSLFTIIPTSVSGTITHVKDRTCLPALGVAAGVGGATTSPVGVLLASISPEWTIMVVAALVIFYSAFTMFKKAVRLRSRKAEEDKPAKSAEDLDLAFEGRNSKGKVASEVAGGAGAGRADSLPAGRQGAHDFPKEGKLPKKTLLAGGAIGLVAGLASGYVGVGGGFLIVPMFMRLLGTPMKLTSGTSLIAVMILAVPGTILQVLLGNVDLLAGIFIALGAVPGAVVGSKLIKRVSELSLRFGFSVFLLIASSLLILNQMGII